MTVNQLLPLIFLAVAVVLVGSALGVQAYRKLRAKKEEERKATEDTIAPHAEAPKKLHWKEAFRLTELTKSLLGELLDRRGERGTEIQVFSERVDTYPKRDDLLVELHLDRCNIEIQTRYEWFWLPKRNLQGIRYITEGEDGKKISVLLVHSPEDDYLLRQWINLPYLPKEEEEGPSLPAGTFNEEIFLTIHTQLFDLLSGPHSVSEPNDP